MQVKWIGRQLVAVTCVALLGTACTPEPQPAASSGPVVTTPVETAQEREQRLAYEAAEKSYRQFRAELRAVTGRGGADDATKSMRATAAGPYLKANLSVVRAYRDQKGYTKGQPGISKVSPAGYETQSLLLDVCEDERSVVTFDKNNKRVAANGLNKLRLEARFVDGRWKVWSEEGEEVTECG